MQSPLEKTRVKPGTMLIETVLSWDSLYNISYDFCTVLDSGQKHIGIRRGCTYEEREDSGCVNINDKGTIGPKSF